MWIFFNDILGANVYAKKMMVQLLIRKSAIRDVRLLNQFQNFKYLVSYNWRGQFSPLIKSAAQEIERLIFRVYFNLDIILKNTFAFAIL